MPSPDDLPTVTHAGISYLCVPMDGMRAVAEGLSAARRPWHSHLLSPGCDHNPFGGQYAVVVEDDTLRRAHICPSDGFPELDRELVQMLHGADILDPGRTVARTGAPAPDSRLPSAAVALDARGVPWHHHMCFPGCALSPARTRWVITVESAEGVVWEAFDAEPSDVLRELEVRYFARLDGHPLA